MVFLPTLTHFDAFLSEVSAKPTQAGVISIEPAARVIDSGAELIASRPKAINSSAGSVASGAEAIDPATEAINSGAKMITFAPKVIAFAPIRVSWAGRFWHGKCRRERTLFSMAGEWKNSCRKTCAPRLQDKRPVRSLYHQGKPGRKMCRGKTCYAIRRFRRV
jgi:hypothetical protein